MSPEIEAAIIAGGVGVLTLLGTLGAQFYGIQRTSRDTEKTLKEQSDLLDRTLKEQRTRTLNERFATAADKLGSDKPPAVRLAGVYAMAGLADDWPENRQTCVDVLCAYLRLPYAPDPGDDPAAPEQLDFRASSEVRHTVIRVITGHLKADAAVSWRGLNFDFTGVVFDGGDFGDTEFSGSTVSFRSAQFSGGTVDFRSARFSGGTVDFNRTEFSGGTVDFGDAEFSGGTVDFSGAEFSGGTVDFGGAEFSGGTVDFGGGQFCGSAVSFRGAKFSGGTVSFRGGFGVGNFSGGTVDFSGAEFSGGTVGFFLAEFSGGEVDFGAAEFSGGIVSFSRAKFSGGTVDFSGDFGGTKFSGGTVDFGGAKFSGGTVDFSGDFGGAEFSGGTVDFGGAEFSGGAVDFSNVGDWSCPPKFPWIGTPPTGVKLRRNEGQSQASPGDL
jgi:uncharacterized protein YjbI with pentapeptide repeats